jgi:hypothetical protein
VAKDRGLGACQVQAHGVPSQHLVWEPRCFWLLEDLDLLLDLRKRLEEAPGHFFKAVNLPLNESLWEKKPRWRTYGQFGV